MTDPFDEHCRTLAHPSKTNFGISLFILIGILVSYLPQHHRIAARRSSEGISPYFVLLGTTSGTCAFANALALPASRADMACCRVNSAYSCFAGVLGVLQVATQYTCFAVIMVLFLAYFPRPDAEDEEEQEVQRIGAGGEGAEVEGRPPATDDGDGDNDGNNGLLDEGVLPTTHEYRTAVLVVAVCLAHALATAIASLVISARWHTHLQLYANVLGLCAAALAAVQFLPQIWTTWQLGTVASLSIPMMCIQTPGSYVWAASLAARFGWAGWSTWGLYLMTGAMQGCLLVMGVAFELRNRRERKLVEEGEPTESSPLLVGGGSTGEGDGR